MILTTVYMACASVDGLRDTAEGWGRQAMLMLSFLLNGTMGYDKWHHGIYDKWDI